jgi:hypothetical protein
MTTSLVGLPKNSHRSQSANNNNNNNNNTKISLQNFHLFFPTNHDERLDGCVLQRVYKNRRRISPTKQHLQETQVFFHQFWWLNSKLVAAAISETLRLSSLY